MRAHRGIDHLDGFIEDTKSVFMGPEFDTKTGSIYELLFTCVNEQAQTRGGIEGSGEHVVNLQKIEKLQDELAGRVNKYFGNLDGVAIETIWSLGDTKGYKDGYVFFKVKITQSLRSMWDVNIDSMTVGLANEVSDLVRYLQTEHTDRTELILNASERGEK